MTLFQTSLDRERALWERRRALCGEEVTLDGEPAVVSGALRSTAHVTILPDGLSCEFAWATVERIINENGGAFHS